MDISFSCTRAPGKPLYRVLADQFIAFIESGRLQAGDPLPPTRDIARNLGVSRYTVVRSYDELVTAGYAECRSTSGTFITGFKRNYPSHKLGLPAHLVAGSVSSYAERITQLEELRPNPEYLKALHFGAPPLALLPAKIWHRLLLQHLNRDLELVYQPDVFGRLELRETLSRYLTRVKGLRCASEQIVIFSQSQNALNLLCRILLSEGDAIAVEEPGFGAIRNICTAQGVTLHPVQVDADGFTSATLKALPRAVRAAYLTPAHHDPTGSVLSPSRRLEILQWAKANNNWVIEDDFDSYFNYGTRSVPVLASQDSDRVIYLGSFWKLLHPVSTICFAVLPASLCELMQTAKTLSEPNSDSIGQLALSDYIREGHLERQARRLRKIYAQRRRTLIFQLKRIFGERITVDRRSAGSHQLIYLPSTLDEDRVCQMAAEAGLGLATTSNHYLEPHRKPGEYLVDFSHLPTEAAAPAVERFHQLLKPN